MQNIVLYGMRGTGKTTIGKMLANKLWFDFYDLDATIWEEVWESVYSFVKEKWWEEFRHKEHETLEKIINNPNQKVIALWWWAILFKNNLEILKNCNCMLIYLDSPVSFIYNRLKDEQDHGKLRNSITGKGFLEEIQELYDERKDIYESLYDIKVQNINTEEECMKDIYRKLKMF